MTICLTMIVKDEAAVIERCLESALPLIDRYLIVDTGSTDNTKIPGRFLSRPWRSFGARLVAQIPHEDLLFMEAAA